MQQNSVIKNITLFFFVSLGLFIGVVLVFAAGGEGKHFIQGVAILLVSAGIFLAAAINIFKRRNSLKSPEDAKGRSQVGFVVDTFQELVGKLKEKEKELERLRAFAEEKAVSIEAYNENILRSVPSGVITISNEMKIKSINQAAEHIIGIKAADAIDKDFTGVLHEPLLSLMKENKTVSRAEYPYITDNGRHIWLGITTSQLKNSAGEKIGLIFIFTDLTDIKALQSQVELKERLSQLGEMSAGISHELRNSMSVISGYAKLLSKKVEESHKAAADAIMAEISNMDEIISELLAFAKPTVLNMESLDINELIKETVRMVIGNNASIDVLLNLAGSVYIKADKVLLRQALTNLAVNAVEAMPDGGKLDIDSRSEYGKAEINIKDTGDGIPGEIIHKIFLPFFTTKKKGTGFGLALVQKIIVSHGGSIECESKEGEGATFRIVLPSEK